MGILLKLKLHIYFTIDCFVYFFEYFRGNFEPMYRLMGTWLAFSAWPKISQAYRVVYTNYFALFELCILECNMVRLKPFLAYRPSEVCSRHNQLKLLVYMSRSTVQRQATKSTNLVGSKIETEFWQNFPFQPRKFWLALNANVYVARWKKRDTHIFIYFLLSVRSAGPTL